MKLHIHCNTELSWHIHVDPKHKRLACTGCKHIMCYYCVAASWLCTAHAHAHGQVASRVGHLQGRKLWNDVMQMVQIVTQSVLYMVWLPYTTTRLLWILCSINVYVYIYIDSNEQLVHALTYSMFHTNTPPNVHSLPGGVFTVAVNTAVSAVRWEVETFTVIL